MEIFLIKLLVAVVLQVVAYLITPKPKSQSANNKELESPTAEAGKPVQVIFGDLTIKDPNCIWYGEKSIRIIKVKV